MSSVLPKSWVECEIGDIAKVVGGSTPPSKDPMNFTTLGGIPWITPADLSGHKNAYISRGARNLSEGGYSACSAVKIPAGSVLFSSRAPVGYAAIASTEVTTNQGFKSFVLPESVDSRFVYYYLRHIKPTAEMMATGTTFKELSGSAATKLPFVLAPLNEQKRIADKLDALLARVDACRERLDRVPQLLKRFRQAVLAAATSGALTEEWRGSQNLEWEKVVLSKICLSITDGDHQAPPQIKDGIPFITISAMNDGNLNLKKATRFVPLSYYEQLKENRRPKVGDILFSVTGSIAIPALVDVEDSFTFQRHIAILKPDLSRIASKYLLYSLGTESIKEQALSVATGTAQLTISLNGLRSLIIDLPPKNEQSEIVRRVETLFAFADRLEARYTVGREQVDQLTPSLLDMAFRGELVPQDPSDEPAEKLLERIRVSRNSELIKPKRKASGRKPKMKITTETVKDVIRQLPKDAFSFEELRDALPGDYESLKDAVFALLNESETLRQFFDPVTQSMRLKRSQP